MLHHRRSWYAIRCSMLPSPHVVDCQPLRNSKVGNCQVDAIDSRVHSLSVRNVLYSQVNKLCGLEVDGCPDRVGSLRCHRSHSIVQTTHKLSSIQVDRNTRTLSIGHTVECHCTTDEVNTILLNGDLGCCAKCAHVGRVELYSVHIDHHKAASGRRLCGRTVVHGSVPGVVLSAVLA